mgnify:CR=1 FL=1
MNNVLFKYPKPRDCIVSDWGGYSRCTKNCGTGSQYRTREILYHPRRGGASCPTLKETRVCNTQSCINPNFKEARTIKNTIGRYIRIEGVNTYIHVQEIEVYDHRNVNIARGLRYPRVTQSSQGWSGHPNYITDGDIAGVLSVIGKDPKNDIYYSIGGGPEGVLAAAALSCYGGQIQGRLVLNEEEKIRAKKLGIKDFSKKYNIDDMIRGDVIFCATGVTDGDLAKGVKDLGNEYEVTTFALHKSKKINKIITNIYNK